MPIQFACPVCKTSYTVKDTDAGKKSECKKCGQRIQVPPPRRSRTVLGESADPVPFYLHPAPVFSRPMEPPPSPEADYSDQTPTLESYTREHHRGAMSPPARVIAGIGTAFLLIGLFLPMVQTPIGGLSFIDVPWKAVTLGFAVVDEIQERPKGSDTPAPRAERTKVERKADEKPDRSGLLILCMAGAFFYPLLILVAVGLAVVVIAQGKNTRRFLFIGIACVGATIAYGVSILLLNAIPELRPLMIFVSPGFGWAVLLIGAALLVAAGAIGFGPSVAIEPRRVLRAPLPVASYAPVEPSESSSFPPPRSYPSSSPSPRRRSRMNVGTVMVIVGIAACFIFTAVVVILIASSGDKLGDTGNAPASKVKAKGK